MKVMEQTRIAAVLRLAQERGHIGTADAMQLLNIDAHDAGRMLFKLRDKGLLEALPRSTPGRGRPVLNRLTAIGRARLCGHSCTTPTEPHFDFGPLIAAFGR